MPRRRRHLTQRGAAALEFAIVLPVLLTILCGTIDWGYYFFTREVVVNASREGARVGTLQFADEKNPRTEAEKAALDYLTGALSSPLTPTISTDKNAQGSDCPETSSCVRIEYPIGGSITGFLGPFIPKSIVAYAEMRK
jgi:Flp pilus assembly protein TadG